MVLAGGNPRKDRHHARYCSRQKASGVANIRPAFVCALARRTSGFERFSDSLLTLVSSKNSSVRTRESNFNTVLPSLTLNSFEGENTEPSKKPAAVDGST